MPGTARSVRKAWAARHQMKHTHIEDVVRQGSGAGSDIDNLTIEVIARKGPEGEAGSKSSALSLRAR